MCCVNGTDGFSDPYVRISIFDEQKQAKYRKQTLNPNWEEDLLFLLPFEYMERILHSNKYNATQSEIIKKDDTDNFFYGAAQATTTHGKSFAAVDINQSVITGLSMPEYVCMGQKY